MLTAYSARLFDVYGQTHYGHELQMAVLALLPFHARRLRRLDGSCRFCYILLLLFHGCTELKSQIGMAQTEIWILDPVGALCESEKMIYALSTQCHIEIKILQNMLMP